MNDTMNEPLKVLMLAAECAPFAKTGGLADVLASLPAPLRERGIDARVMLPKYRTIPEVYRQASRKKEFTYCSVGWRWQYVGLHELLYNGFPCYFIDNEYYFGHEGLYGYNDEAERFAYFCRAALEILPHLGFQPDVIHCHDWHTGMVCALLKAQYKQLPFYRNMRTVFTVHNLAYQGNFPRHVLSDLFGLGDEYFTPDTLEFNGQVSFLKAGLVNADEITTVSETYAQEIQTPEFGEGMNGLLRYRSGHLRGIINGIDNTVYNPAIDPMIWAPYQVGALAGKAVNKAKLQRKLGLPDEPDVPVVGLVSRLTSQKGIDLLVTVLEEILNLDMQLVVLGSGEQYFESLLADAAYRHPDRVAIRIGFDDSLAHQIYAGADLFLMPSRFEPCGLAQLIALRYGTLPLVRETGGLRDTVHPFNEYTGEGNGFSFTAYNAQDMLHSLQHALGFYHEKGIWEELVKQAMTEDWGWHGSAAKYVEVYQGLV